MPKQVNVKALREFSGQMGTKTPDDDAFPLDEKQADELVGLGLVERVGGKVAAAAEPAKD